MQQVCTISNSPNYVIALILLIVFGFCYNLLVDLLESRGLERGITSLLVAIGNAVTLLAVVWLAGIQLFLDIIGLFVASGSVMIVGSLYRYLKQREAEREAASRAHSIIKAEDND